MKWQDKALVMRALSALPGGATAHFWLQRRVTREWPRSSVVLDQLIGAAREVRNHSPQAVRYLEIGAGRDLAVALTLRCLGAEEVLCVDLNRLARIELVAHAARAIASALAQPVPSIASWADLERFGVHYVAPADIREIAASGPSADCFYSIDTLEHIPRDDLPSVLESAGRMLNRNGVFVHLIDYGDHYARGCTSPTPFNFLTFRESDWRRYNPPMHFVNRLRHSEYIALFEQAGLRITKVRKDVQPVDEDIVRRLAPEFLIFDREDLFTQRAMIVAEVDAALPRPSSFGVSPN